MKSGPMVNWRNQFHGIGRFKSDLQKVLWSLLGVILQRKEITMFNGKVLKKDKFWLVEIPALNVVTQGRSKKNALFMIKDAIEELVNEKSFRIKVVPTENKNEFVIYANDVAPLVALMLKRQRAKNGLSLADMQERLHAKSRNAYAQYEQGKSVPSVQKFVEFLNAMGEMALFMCTHERAKWTAQVIQDSSRTALIQLEPSFLD